MIFKIIIDFYKILKLLQITIIKKYLVYVIFTSRLVIIKIKTSYRKTKNIFISKNAETQALCVIQKYLPVLSFHTVVPLLSFKVKFFILILLRGPINCFLNSFYKERFFQICYHFLRQVHSQLFFRLYVSKTHFFKEMVFIKDFKGI